MYQLFCYLSASICGIELAFINAIVGCFVLSRHPQDLSTERNQLNDQLQNTSQENSALKLQLEHVSRELADLKELYDQAQSKGETTNPFPS